MCNKEGGDSNRCGDSKQGGGNDGGSASTPAGASKRRTEQSTLPSSRTPDGVEEAVTATANHAEKKQKKRAMGGFGPRRLGQNNPNAADDAARVVSGTLKRAHAENEDRKQEL